MADQSRRAREAKGRRAEQIAAWLLRLKGYRILAERYKTPVGEIDIIAKRGQVIIFCEVKHRRSQEAAYDAITPRQTQRITRAAQAYLAQHPKFLTCQQRVDALLLVPRRLPVHMHNITAP